MMNLKICGGQKCTVNESDDKTGGLKITDIRFGRSGPQPAIDHHKVKIKQYGKTTLDSPAGLGFLLMYFFISY